MIGSMLVIVEQKLGDAVNEFLAEQIPVEAQVTCGEECNLPKGVTIGYAVNNMTIHGDPTGPLQSLLTSLYLITFCSVFGHSSFDSRFAHVSLPQHLLMFCSLFSPLLFCSVFGHCFGAGNYIEALLSAEICAEKSLLPGGAAGGGSPSPRPTEKVCFGKDHIDTGLPRFLPTFR